MGENEVRPALTPERWRANLHSDEGLAHGASFLGMGGVFTLELVTAPTERHALSALALHGQPFGFTWEMVDGLLSDAGALESEGSDASATRSAAALIAALLPPR